MNRTSVSRPVNARARRSAISVASVPDEVKRTRSADGIRRMTAFAQATSSGWLAPNCVPSVRAAFTALTTSARPWPRISAPWPP